MKFCLSCKTEFEQTDWRCPSCKWMPAYIDGFPAFAPELAQFNDGMPENMHHVLNDLQENSFWFRGRNQLIQTMIQRYFANANSVLEIGCGSGFVLNGIRNVLPRAELTATEIYSHGLHYAYERVKPPTQFLQVDAREIPFKKEFDLIGAFDVLEHIDDDVGVIKNIRESLNPNGGVILTVPQHPWLWSKTDDFACHKRRYRRKQLSVLLRDHDFHILMDTSFMFLLLPLMLMQRFIANKKTQYDQTKELALPKILDRAFAMTLKIENVCIKRGISFPIGGSRLVVAKRNT